MEIYSQISLNRIKRILKIKKMPLQSKNRGEILEDPKLLMLLGRLNTLAKLLKGK
jgi:hypothetical protein